LIKKVLLTGAGGFIGRNFFNKYKNSYKIVGITKKVSSYSNDFIEVDLSNPSFTDYLPDSCDVVIHMAHSKLYREFPEGADDMREININSTCRLLEWARKKKIEHFLFFSTANVYGPSSHLLAETSTAQPKSFYGNTKLCAEKLATCYRNFFRVTILRLFTVYGPGQENMLIPNMIKKIMQKEEIFFTNGHGPFLSPIYLYDLLEIIDKIIRENIDVETLNLCGDEVLTLKQIVDIISGKLKINPNIKNTNDTQLNFSGCNKKLHKKIADLKMTKFAEGIIKVLEEYKN
tara:strand:- start:191 stop:1057 length:867 start_codon:yes stop_codon:yes gene_type:complete